MKDVPLKRHKTITKCIVWIHNKDDEATLSVKGDEMQSHRL